MDFLRKIKNVFLEIDFFLKDKKYMNFSFSQEGEDIVLARYLAQKENGFYVDVGAHHPKRFSNTYFFYRKGWNGINIDALPGTKKYFDQVRPRDINLEIGVSEKKEKLTYYSFNEPALNTFSEIEAKNKDRLHDGKYFIQNKTEIPTDSLENILNYHLPKNKSIDFLSIDAEGLDLMILKSNNWSKYKPDFILVEELRVSSLPKMLQESQVYDFLTQNNYSLVSRTFNTSIYKHNE